MIEFCKNCVMPSSKPNISFVNGICSSCNFHFYEKAKKINWNYRKKEFNSLIKEIKKKNNNSFDVLVPVSGGKDSWYQIIKSQSEGLNILCVTWRTPMRTKIGQQN